MFRVLIKVFIYKICVLILFLDYCFGINNVIISNVPSKNIYFTGRDNELNTIKSLFKAHNILAIVGSAGIGKTQIAKQYANNSAEYDLIWWIESGKSIVAQYLKLVDDLNGKQLLAETLYVPMNSEANAIKKVRDTLEQLCMNMLFIFDDFDNYTEIKDFIPTSKACPKKKLSVLVTSKNLLSWNNSIRIEEFHRDESIDLFRQFIGNRGTQSMNKLSKALGDYPIAITQSAVYLKTNPNVSIEQYIELFYNRRAALWGYEEKLVTQQHADLDNYKKTVFTAVGINVKELKQKSENAFKLALLISFMHSSDIPEKILKKNFKDILEMNEAISSIQSNALLVLNGRRNTEVDSDNFYSIHEVQQAVIQDLATDNEKKESIKKLAENLNALLPKQIDLFVPMLIEKPYLIQHLEKVCKHAKKLNILDDNILNLHIRRLEYVLSFKKDFNAAAEIIQNIEDLLMQAPKSSISSLTKTRFKLMELTYLSWHKGAYQTSIEMANNVLEDLVKLSDVDEEYLMTYNKLAQSYLYIGDVENSLKYSDLGQKVVDRTVGYLGNKDAFYSIRARILLDLGKFEEALDNIKLSSAHAQKWERPMTILATQALILFKMEKYQESYDTVNESFKAACSMFGDEDSPLAAFQLTIIAASSLKIGNIEEANCNIERAMKILQETYKDNIHRSHAFAYIVYGDIKVAQGLYDEAQNAYLLADSMYCKVMLNKKIDDVSYLYTQLAINSARLSDKLRAFFYLDEHRDLFGEANKRTLAVEVKI